LLHEIAVSDARSMRELSLAPAIQAVSRTGAPLERRIKPPGLALEERLGLGIVRIETDRQIEPESTLNVSYALPRQGSSRGTLDLSMTEEVPDGLLDLVLPQQVGRSQAERLRERLQLRRIPIAVIELLQCHCL